MKTLENASKALHHELNELTKAMKILDLFMANKHYQDTKEYYDRLESILQEVSKKERNIVVLSEYIERQKTIQKLNRIKEGMN